MTDRTTSNSSETDGLLFVSRSLDPTIDSSVLFSSDERSECIRQLIYELFTGRKPAASVLVSFCAKFKRKLLFNETTANYHYANFVSSRIKRSVSHVRQSPFDLVDQVEFPQGLAKSKKDARASAARYAMARLLDINEEQLNPQYLGRITWEILETIASSATRQIEWSSD